MKLNFDSSAFSTQSEKLPSPEKINGAVSVDKELSLTFDDSWDDQINELVSWFLINALPIIALNSDLTVLLNVWKK